MPKAREINPISHDELINILDYNPETGQFVWKENRGYNKVKGLETGYISIKTGYKLLQINKIRYLAQRLAWFYIYKKWPEYTIDHIDRNRNNNKIDNLRDISFVENQWNKKRYESGRLVGTHYRASRKHKKWWSGIYLFDPIKQKKLVKHLGVFETELEAHNAYIIAHNNLIESNNE